ncbi:MAG: hypothetical protein ABH881_00090 [bacterium]
MNNDDFSDINKIFKKKEQDVASGKIKKTTAYQWQELALKIIEELNVPNFKRSAVFKACKENSKIFIERCLTDTKELCKSGDGWKYFFKAVTNKEHHREKFIIK